MNKQKLVTPKLMWLIVAAGIFLAFWILPSKYLFPRTTISAFVFALTFMYGVYSWLTAFKVHPKAPRSVFEIDKLVKEGIYARVRHPMYSGDIILAWGLFLYFPNSRVLASIGWLTIVLLFWMRIEEKALSEKFGEEYNEYKRRVPMIFPKWRK